MLDLNGAPEEIRTPAPQIRSLRVRKVKTNQWPHATRAPKSRFDCHVPHQFRTKDHRNDATNGAELSKNVGKSTAATFVLPLITVWLQVRTKLARMPDVTAPLAILFALQISRISYVWCVRFSPSFLSAPIFHRLWSKEERVNGIAELCIFAGRIVHRG